MPLKPKKSTIKAPPVTRIKYPELDNIARHIANTTCFMINQWHNDLTSDMPYKRQYILEEIIKILEERV